MRQQLDITSLAAVFTAMIALAGIGGCSPTSAAAKQCDDQACFTRHFSDCEAATYTTEKQAAAQAEYRIMGSSDAGCRVQFQYTTNPNPAWVDKPLTMTLDPGQPYEPQMKKALESCLMEDKPGPHDCSGPLRGIASPAGAGFGAPAGAGDKPRESQAATGRPCGKTVEVDGEPLYPLPRDGKWGYVNRAGDWVIEPRWRQAEQFSEGRAVVDGGSADGSAWGIIDRDGNYVLEPSLRSQAYSTIDGARLGSLPVRPFSQSCAAVAGATGSDDPYFVTRDGKFWLHDGLPDSLADWNIQQFGSFSEGLAWFQLNPEEFGAPQQFGWIDPDGAVAIAPEYEGAGNFVDGLSPAGLNKDHWGYINPEGELVWPSKWTLKSADSFSGGLARITMKQYGPGAYFDGNDTVIREVHFDPPRTFNTRAKGEKTIDRIEMEDGGAFADGLAPVTLPFSPNPLVYMDTRGKAVFAPGLNHDMTICSQRRLPQFRHGLARLRVANEGDDCGTFTRIDNSSYFTYTQSHYIYIDTKGQIVLEEPFRDNDSDARPPKENGQ